MFERVRKHTDKLLNEALPVPMKGRNASLAAAITFGFVALLALQHSSGRWMIYLLIIVLVMAFGGLVFLILKKLQDPDTRADVKRGLAEGRKTMMGSSEE